MQSSWAYMQSGTYMKVQVWTKSRTSGLGDGVAPVLGLLFESLPPVLPNILYHC